jgi:hypothetical protein
LGFAPHEAEKAAGEFQGRITGENFSRRIIFLPGGNGARSRNETRYATLAQTITSSPLSVAPVRKHRAARDTESTGVVNPEFSSAK